MIATNRIPFLIKQRQRQRRKLPQWCFRTVSSLLLLLLLLLLFITLSVAMETTSTKVNTITYSVLVVLVVVAIVTGTILPLPEQVQVSGTATSTSSSTEDDIVVTTTTSTTATVTSSVKNTCASRTQEQQQQQQKQQKENDDSEECFVPTTSTSPSRTNAEMDLQQAQNDTTTSSCCTSNSTSTNTIINNNSNNWSYNIMEMILESNYYELDGIVLMNSIKELKKRGAHRCWHKHSTFLEHLVGVHNILRIWGQGSTIGRVGLFHSAYSNSYVNLALFDRTMERSIMKQLIGTDAEELVYLFCIINRQDVVVNTLLKHGYIPMDGMFVQHLHIPNELVYLSPESLRMLLVFSMADTAEQYFSWQDELFGLDSAMLLPGKDKIEQHNPYTMWPGIYKPGIWMTYVNQLAMVVQTFNNNNNNNSNTNSKNGNSNNNNKKTQTEKKDKTNDSNDFSDDNNDNSNNNNNEQRMLDIPPIFENCTKRLTIENETIARDLYWSVITNTDDRNNNNNNSSNTTNTTTTTTTTSIIDTLLLCHQYNPYIYEPLVLLGQQYLYQNEHNKAKEILYKALVLQQQWGTSWDKRIQYNAWVAWTRVLYQRCGGCYSCSSNDINNTDTNNNNINSNQQQQQHLQSWPTNSWDINNFGLVK